MYQGVEFLCWRYIFSFPRYCQTALQATFTIYPPTSSIWEGLLPHTFVINCQSGINFYWTDGCENVSPCGFNWPPEDPLTSLKEFPHPSPPPCCGPSPSSSSQTFTVVPFWIFSSSLPTHSLAVWPPPPGLCWIAARIIGEPDWIQPLCHTPHPSPPPAAHSMPLASTFPDCPLPTLHLVPSLSLAISSSSSSTSKSWCSFSSYSVPTTLFPLLGPSHPYL